MAKIRCSLIPITTWRMRNVHFPVHFPFAHARNAHARLFAHLLVRFARVFSVLFGYVFADLRVGQQVETYQEGVRRRLVY